MTSSSYTYPEDPFTLPGTPPAHFTEHAEPNPIEGPNTKETTIPTGGPTTGGKRAVIPPSKQFPRWNTQINTPPQDEYDAVDDAEEADYTDLTAVNRDLQKLRVMLNRARRYHRQAEREAIEAQTTYKRALRRALVQQTGGSAETRKANAELMCEELETQTLIKTQEAAEWASRMRTIRDDIDNAKTIAYNLRTLSGL